MGAQIVIWTFYDQVVKVEKGWVEQEFVLLIIAALPNGAVLPSKYPTGYFKKYIKNTSLFAVWEQPCRGVLNTVVLQLIFLS